MYQEGGGRGEEVGGAEGNEAVARGLGVGDAVKAEAGGAGGLEVGRTVADEDGVGR